MLRTQARKWGIFWNISPRGIKVKASRETVPDTSGTTDLSVIFNLEHHVAKFSFPCALFVPVGVVQDVISSLCILVATAGYFSGHGLGFVAPPLYKCPLGEL